MPKVFVIGLDGADPRLIEKWKDDLPNLKDMMKQGAYGILESTVPAETCPAWSCFCTGKNPGSIGVYGFVQLDRSGTLKLVDSKSVQSEAIWDHLGQYGKRVAVLNVPVTYPPSVVNGFMVSGIPTPVGRRDYTFPGTLAMELDELVGGYEVDVMWAAPERGGEEEFLKQVSIVHSKRLTATRYLMRRYNWDFFIVVFRALDLVQHHFWHYMDPASPEHPSREDHRVSKYENVIKEWYARMDESIGQITEMLDDKTYLVIASDHGFGCARSCFLVNEWLKDQGLLRLERENKHVSDWNRSAMLRARDLVLGLLGPALTRKLLRVVPVSLQTRGTTSGAVRRSIDGFLRDIDWTRSRAFAIGGNSARFYLTLNDKPFQAHRSEREYEDLRREIAYKLSEIKETDKRERFSCKVYTKEELYWGKHADVAPDLAVEFFVDDLKCTATLELGTDPLAGYWTKPFVTGTHLREGVWLIRGPNVKNKRIDARIMDLAPTMLRMFDVHIPDDMDGRVLEEIFDKTGELEEEKESS
jgi:predicted AlkP superfamily phosphohydrolase/phosphomutase